MTTADYSYSTGTASITSGTAALTGAGTAWLNSGLIFPGDMVLYEPASGASPSVIGLIDTVTADGAATLAATYYGTTRTNVPYRILYGPMHYTGAESTIATQNLLAALASAGLVTSGAGNPTGSARTGTWYKDTTNGGWWQYRAGAWKCELGGIGSDISSAPAGVLTLSGLDGRIVTISFTTTITSVVLGKGEVVKTRATAAFVITTGASLIGNATSVAIGDWITWVGRNGTAVDFILTRAAVTVANLPDAGILSGLRNKIINGNFDIWQRGTSFSITTYTYCADRWQCFSTGATVSQQAFSPGQTEVPGNPSYYLRFSQSTTDVSGIVGQKIENVATLSGQTATITFYARYYGSAPSGSLQVRQTQQFGSGGSADVITAATTLTLTSSWAKYSATVTLPSISGKTVGAGNDLWLLIRNGTGEAWGIDIAHVSLVEDDATGENDPFASRSPQQELALCQRRCLVLASGGLAGSGYGYTSTVAKILIPTPTTMAAIPSVVLADSRVFHKGSSLTPTGVAITKLAANGVTLDATVASGITVYEPAELYLVQALTLDCEL